MTINGKMACVFGGTGFIGRQVVRELARAGYTVKIASRAPESAFFLKTAGAPGQIVPMYCDYSDDDNLGATVQGCQVVVNCVGILAQRGRARFTALHAALPGRIAGACADAGVARFVHVSALGADKAESKYAQSKRKGEEAVFAHFPGATIVRPSVVFGPGDGFFAMFARLAIYAPALPLIGGGTTKLQPVYVGDVADAIMHAATMPPSMTGPQGTIYELGGPEIITLREAFARVLKQTGRKRRLVSLSWGLSSLQGRIMGMLPGPLLTADQVKTLKTDNIISGNYPGLADLGVNPTAIGTILPTYLACYRPGGRFGDKKRA